MSWNEYRDAGGGSTEKSLDYFFRAARRIAKEWGVARPVHIEISANGGLVTDNPKRAAYTMRIQIGREGNGEPYEILLSGTQAGYGGTGPHGTATILRYLGVPETIVDRVFSEEQLDIEWADGQWKTKLVEKTA